MRVAGVITEYNPFHNGHKYQLDEIRKRTSADYIIVVMSGNFVQRGTPAIMDKYSRAQMALSNGADLVLEMPVIWSTASAEYFAKAGVSILKSTGVVNYLCFGAESDDLSLLNNISSSLACETDSFKDRLNLLLKSGLPYPAARIKALELSESMTSSITKELSSPNNILAIEYLKALNELNTIGTNSIEPILIKRIGDGYSSSMISSSFASATALRNALTNQGTADLSLLTPCMDDITTFSENHGLISDNSVSEMLHYRLILDKDQGFCKYADCSEALSGRIVKLLPKYESFTQFVELLKTKDMTYSRICRVLIHILLGITTEDYTHARTTHSVPYLKVLGFRKSATPLLSAIKKEATAPLITKVADASLSINHENMWLFEKDITASDIYGALIIANHKKPIKNDYSHELVTITAP